MKKVGQIVNTHGIKGELRILSGKHFSNNNFKNEYKTLIIDNKIYNVKNYRFHKNFHQVCLEGYDNINDVLFLKGKSVFVDQQDNSIDLDSLINTKVFLKNKEIGKVVSISHTKLYKLLNLDSNQIIPINDNFIILLTKERIEVKNI